MTTTQAKLPKPKPRAVAVALALPAPPAPPPEPPAPSAASAPPPPSSSSEPSPSAVNPREMVEGGVYQYRENTNFFVQRSRYTAKDLQTALERRDLSGREMSLFREVRSNPSSVLAVRVRRYSGEDGRKELVDHILLPDAPCLRRLDVGESFKLALEGRL